MSHTVKIKTQFKDLSMFKKALKALGWDVKENTKIRTYHSDPNRDELYKYVAVNPKANGFDVGVKVKPDGEMELFADFYDGSIASTLGADLTKLRQQYATEVTIDELTFNGYVCNTSTDTKGNVIIEAEKA